MENKAVTIKEIARRLGISPSSVSRALHDHKSIGLRTKANVQKLAKELNYERNQTAIFFQQGKTFTIGVILPELSEDFFSSAISGIEDSASLNNYTVLVGQSHDNEDREIQITNTMRLHHVDGLIVSIAKSTSNYEHFEALKKYDIPIVFFDRIPNMANIHYVACNMSLATTQAFSYLKSIGHRTIGLINGPKKLLASKDRMEGYRNGLTKCRLKYDPSLVIHCNLTKEEVCKATRELLTLKNKPTAIIAFNDYVLLDAIDTAKKMKLKINKDISFVSFANLPLGNYIAHPPLASVEQFSYEQGQKAMGILLNLLSSEKKPNGNNGYQKIIIEPKLIVNR